MKVRCHQHAAKPRVRRTVEVRSPALVNIPHVIKVFGTHHPRSTDTPSNPRFSLYTRTSWLQLLSTLIELIYSLKWLAHPQPADLWPSSLGESQSLDSPFPLFSHHRPMKHSKGSNQRPPQIDVVVWSCRASTSRTRSRRKTD